MSKDNPKTTADPAAPAAAPPREETAEEKAALTGRVKHDERGQAVWEWAVATGAFATDVSDQRLKKLENPGLRLLDDQPTPGHIVKPNPHGTVKGYSPYDSGLLVGKKEAPRKKDLKKLSEWLKLRKQASTNKQDDE